jgi:DNA-binding response OmpR family regulator
MSDTVTLSAERLPTVYFIDDSATMREVIKIAFRRESINVITCHDAASALAQFDENAPDAVITDVIMPDKDGYEVCKSIKENPELRKTPVILMSGVVNRTVAEKAIAVQADELIRKPFQPQDLIARVKNLLNPKPIASPSAESAAAHPSHQTSAALSGIFAAAPSQPAPAMAARPANPAPAVQGPAPSAPAAPASRANGADSTASAGEIQKLRNEVRRLEMLVKKLQSALQAEREYVASLEEHLKTLQEAE